jgi:hypothetical protein
LYNPPLSPLSLRGDERGVTFKNFITPPHPLEIITPLSPLYLKRGITPTQKQEESFIKVLIIVWTSNRVLFLCDAGRQE